jgi:hypothetical protein
LQRLTGRPVLNGGVAAYGLDQIVLRAEQLADRYSPSVVIVSFIEDDLQRTEMRTLWWRDKPWFAIEDGELVHKAASVPEGARLPRRLHAWLGRCCGGLPPDLLARAQHLENQLVGALPPGLQHRVGCCVRAHPAGAGLEIAQRLVERLAGLQRTHNIRLVMMAQYPPAVWTDQAEARRQRHAAQAVLDCAAACGLAVLDTYHRLAAEPAPHRLYAQFHMNARGNAMIAGLMAATLPALTLGRAQY